MKTVLRAARPEDAQLLWVWRNDPDVRRQSFSADEIPWEVHEAWFARKLASPDTRIWILEADGVPAGQIRVERTGSDAKISFSVDRTMRRRGVGRRLLAMAGPVACRELGVRRLVGFVKAENTASQRAFEEAGFVRAGMETVQGTQSVRFELACSSCGGGGS
jgi:RimJ/RimL family protein N-acetyltransferase